MYGVLVLKQFSKEELDNATRPCWDMNDFSHVIANSDTYLVVSEVSAAKTRQYEPRIHPRLRALPLQPHALIGVLRAEYSVLPRSQDAHGTALLRWLAQLAELKR
jgi:hypothetical protein